MKWIIGPSRSVLASNTRVRVGLWEFSCAHNHCCLVTQLCVRIQWVMQPMLLIKLLSSNSFSRSSALFSILFPSWMRKGMGAYGLSIASLFRIREHCILFYFSLSLCDFRNEDCVTIQDAV